MASKTLAESCLELANSVNEAPPRNRAQARSFLGRMKRAASKAKHLMRLKQVRDSMKERNPPASSRERAQFRIR